MKANEAKNNEEKNMKTYTCQGFKAVKAENIDEAARTFANRQARREFGSRGYARTCTQGSYSQDGTTAEYSAFIGRTTPGNPHETTGHNVSFTVAAR